MVSVIRYVFYIAVVAILIAILANYKMSDKVNDAHIKISAIEEKLAWLDIQCVQADM